MSERMGIGDFARRAGMAISAVRFYGDRGLLPPAWVDPATGYRSYAEDQVADAALIRDLRRLDMPLAEVARYMAAGPGERQALLAGHLDRLERRLADARHVAHDLHTRTTRTELPMPTASPPDLAVDAADLGAALDQVLPAAGRDPEQPVLTCVLVEGRDGSLRLAATDRYRLAVRDVAAGAAGGTAAFRGLLPAATLGRWRSGLPDAGVLSVGVRGDHMVVRGEDVDLRALPVPATFPAYEDVLAAAGDAHAVVASRDALHAALVAFADEPGAVLVRVTPGRLALVRRDREVAIDAQHEGPDLDVALDPAFAADAVAAAVGPDVVVEISGALRPLVFRSADDGTFTTLLMPVRLD